MNKMSGFEKWLFTILAVGFAALVVVVLAGSGGAFKLRWWKLAILS